MKGTEKQVAYAKDLLMQHRTWCAEPIPDRPWCTMDSDGSQLAALDLLAAIDARDSAAADAAFARPAGPAGWWQLCVDRRTGDGFPVVDAGLVIEHCPRHHARAS